ncbi:hypothetical protein [Methylorubrum podarium]|uniref:hypothetical protein n=1 Tax=Methylorubrum podarium TaxID=200476 RepID=UPI001EE1AEC7|nr:hypothetical protein [Methylorubrum podarium]GJE72154.1 hypothetical protein CHKEEEPN_3708 [Methylorubrum podarium]
MTAMNTIVTPTAVHVSTDGASYLRDGQIVWEGQKVGILAHLPAVIGVRGPSMHVPSIVANVSANFTGFDPLVAAAARLFRAIHEQYGAAMAAQDRAHEAHEDAEFVVAGWSEERDRPEAYGVHSHGRNGLKAWTLFEIPGLSISPSDPELIDRLDFLNLETVLTNVEATALRIMELQRERPFEMESGRATVAAGAFCQLTTLTRSGVTTRILKRWGNKTAPASALFRSDAVCS